MKETLNKLDEKEDSVGLSSMELKIQETFRQHYADKEARRKLRERQADALRRASSS